jgi:hypothetical protein
MLVFSQNNFNDFNIVVRNLHRKSGKKSLHRNIFENEHILKVIKFYNFALLSKINSRNINKIVALVLDDGI